MLRRWNTILQTRECTAAQPRSSFLRNLAGLPPRRNHVTDISSPDNTKLNDGKPAKPDDGESPARPFFRTVRNERERETVQVAPEPRGQLTERHFRRYEANPKLSVPLIRKADIFALSLYTNSTHFVDLQRLQLAHNPARQPPPFFALFRELPAPFMEVVYRDLSELCRNQGDFPISSTSSSVAASPGTVSVHLAQGAAETESMRAALKVKWQKFLSVWDCMEYEPECKILTRCKDKAKLQTVFESMTKTYKGFNGLARGLSVYRLYKGKWWFHEAAFRFNGGAEDTRANASRGNKGKLQAREA